MNIEELYAQIGAPDEPRDQHNKIYTEKSVKEAIKDVEIKMGYSSFSDAGRAVLLVGLFHIKEYQK